MLSNQLSLFLLALTKNIVKVDFRKKIRPYSSNASLSVTRTIEKLPSKKIKRMRKIQSARKVRIEVPESLGILPTEKLDSIPVYPDTTLPTVISNLKKSPTINNWRSGNRPTSAFKNATLEPIKNPRPKTASHVLTKHSVISSGPVINKILSTDKTS